jgi:hypothetical protein
VRIDWALPCRYAEAAADGTATIVGAGLDSLWVGELPADVGTFMMLRIAAPPDEFETEHQLALRLVDPERDEHDVLSVGFGPVPEPPPLLHPGLEAGLLIPVGVGWQAEHYGLYTLEVYVDERRQRSLPILVRDAQELEPKP